MANLWIMDTWQRIICPEYFGQVYVGALAPEHLAQEHMIYKHWEGLSILSPLKKCFEIYD